MKIIHEGRSGYIEYQGYRYIIELVNAGHFCIHFPSGNNHTKLQAHLDTLTEFSARQNPKWIIENQSQKYK